MRGSRVQAIVNELQGEKIDIINWSESLANLAISSLAPAEVLKVVLDEEQNKIEVVVDESHLSLAIGRRGQNVKLASELTGWDIDILTEAEESTKRQADFIEKTKMIVDAIDVDETLAQLLVTEGFASIEEIAETEKSEFLNIEGFDEEVVSELIERASTYLEKTEKENKKTLSDLKVEDKFIEFWKLSSSMLVTLAKNKIITLDEFAGLTTDDLIGYFEDKHDKSSKVIGLLDGFNLTRDEADELILEARKIWLN